MEICLQGILSKYFLLLLLVYSHCFIASGQMLFDTKGSYFTIATSQGSKAEKDAAQMLQTFLERQSGQRWVLNTGRLATNNVIIVQETPNPQRYTIEIKNGKTIKLQGGGTILKTCVAAFLERFTGCNVYADDAVVTPHLLQCPFPANFSFQSTAAFSRRLLFEHNAFDSLFITWHGLSNQPGPLNHEKTFGIGLWAHTFFQLVPPERYFSTHPEYFSLRNGRRIAEQLCLSNKEVLAVATASLKDFIRKQPNLAYWSVSQMDNQNYCECEGCKKIMAEEAAASGPVIRFVNAIAQQVPDKKIVTLAYQYTRKPPVKVKPLGNVVLCFCTIEADRNKTIPQQPAIASDLSNWATITTNLMVWDYFTNGISVGSPFPDFYTLASNFKYYKSIGVKEIFGAGWNQSGGGFQEFRAYLVSKLLWNPDADVQIITTNFFNGYYGIAGKLLLQVYNIINEAAVRSGVVLSIGANTATYAGSYLTPDLRRQYLSITKRAMDLVKDDPVFYKRVDAFTQAFRIANVEVEWANIWKQNWVRDNTPQQRLAIKQHNDSLLNEYVTKTALYGPITIMESSLSPAEYKQQMEERLQTDVENNRLIGANITFKEPYIFQATGMNALIDGGTGNDDWSSTWQGWRNVNITANIILQQPISASYFSMRFMQDLPSDIVLPDEVQVWMSNDGKNFRKMATVNRPTLNKNVLKQVADYRSKLPSGLNFQYLRIIAVCPTAATPGSKTGDRYLFSDEVYVQ